MSRIGKIPVQFDKTKIQVSVDASNTVTIKGAKEALTVDVRPQIKVEPQDGTVVLTRENDEAQVRAWHGLYRVLISNAVKGLTEGFKKELVLNGVGYRASMKGQNLELSLGFSHPILHPVPKGISVKVDKQTNISVEGADCQLVGQVAANIRRYRPPEPFLGKGVKYKDEVIVRKAGKSAGK